MKKQTWRAGNMLYPVPAVMVTCKRKNEKANIITVAWAGTVCSDPAMVSISVRKSRYSHEIISETKEFVVNLTTKQLAKATDYCGVKSGRDIDKFKEMNLHTQESTKIETPGILESPVNIECKVVNVLELGTHDMFIAEVVAVDVNEDLLDEKGSLHLDKADLIAYAHGQYFSLGKELGRFGFSVRKNIKNKAKKKSKPKKK
ncbi:flavin reductase family protein [Lachnospira multipara]|jgi:flavin reductase (DIM6/NTAB) family NADH-FMN oxidoreductase RutF|uniref:flavin reductase family protein n=1 Tax=Lachnospira multipara TaxID=28051 RepID=UPI0004E23606|nr:flavin reductase family protein [Lachnospira multipara]